MFIRWGRADILNPTDRFAPRDFMNVIDPDFLPVLASIRSSDSATTPSKLSGFRG